MRSERLSLGSDCDFDEEARILFAFLMTMVEMLGFRLERYFLVWGNHLLWLYLPLGLTVRSSMMTDVDTMLES